MWNEDRPLELLKNMPHVLTAENLAADMRLFAKTAIKRYSSPAPSRMCE